MLNINFKSSDGINPVIDSKLIRKLYFYTMISFKVCMTLYPTVFVGHYCLCGVMIVTVTPPLLDLMWTTDRNRLSAN